MNPSTLLAWVLGAGAVATGLAIGVVLVKTFGVLRKFVRLIDDWYGDDQRPGLSARLDDLREALDAHVRFDHGRRAERVRRGDAPA